jgi:Sulfotransferase family
VFFKKAPRARPLFFLARPAGLAYLQVPKVACTSFKIAMAIINRPELAKELGEAPLRIHSQPEFSDIADENSPLLRNLFRFTFVRNPMERFLSFYQNKIFYRPKGTVAPSIAEAGFRVGMPLGEVLDRIEKTAESELDPHIAPQNWFVFDRKRSRVNFIGHVERLAEDLEKLEKLSGVPVELGHYNKSPIREQHRFELADRDAARIREFYAEDFALLGYD